MVAERTGTSRAGAGRSSGADVLVARGGLTGAVGKAVGVFKTSALVLGAGTGTGVGASSELEAPAGADVGISKLSPTGVGSGVYAGGASISCSSGLWRCKEELDFNFFVEVEGDPEWGEGVRGTKGELERELADEGEPPGVKIA